ncbi:hypothetical protein J6590_010565 [Homalodisca vitripennis]|nr:hypothetical protein J6590_010565 [Homalodisca vitripennis]
MILTVQQLTAGRQSAASKSRDQQFSQLSAVCVRTHAQPCNNNALCIANEVYYGGSACSGCAVAGVFLDENINSLVVFADITITCTSHILPAKISGAQGLKHNTVIYAGPNQERRNWEEMMGRDEMGHNWWDRLY